jgi:hypothetical protein
MSTIFWTDAAADDATACPSAVYALASAVARRLAYGTATAVCALALNGVAVLALLHWASILG